MKAHRRLWLAVVVVVAGATFLCGSVFAEDTAPEKQSPPSNPPPTSAAPNEGAPAEKPAPPPTQPDYSGSLLDRTTLTGDWFGLRNTLAEKGITLDATLTQVTQGIVRGGTNSGWQYGGRDDFTLNIDTGKLGLWPGGFFNAEAEHNFEDSVNSFPRAIMPVNGTMIFPSPNEGSLNIPALNFTQFVCEYLGFTAGKYDTMSGDANAFAHGKGDTQFMNLAMNINPVVFLTSPYSTLGAGAIVLPTKDPNAAIVSFLVMSADGQANTSGLNDLRSDAMTTAGEGRVRTDFFGLTGHQLVGATYANKTYTSLNQDARDLIQNRALTAENHSWSLYYNFDQYLYQPTKDVDKGIGIFGRYGIADSASNPVMRFYSAGVGGKGIVPLRPNDTFGIGGYYINISNPSLTILRRTVSLLGDEEGLEAYYNIALTKWFILTPDIQFIGPAQQRTVNGSSIGSSTILGLRLQMVF
jgi:porin